MDFKVAGTEKGITGIQLDMKSRGIPHERMREALERARQARSYILQRMGEVLPAPRSELNQYAPRMLIVKIDPEKIGKVIGPGGKTINRIQAETGATIDVEDDGSIFIGCSSAEGAEAAKAEIEALTAEAEIGKIYTGKVVSITDFGAFVEILPGQDGLCHVSELSSEYVKKVTDVVNLGDTLDVKVISIDAQGRIKLSRKAVTAEGTDGGDSGSPASRRKSRKRGRRRRL
jgi:polyribonucleotide nucleotidyltransferase